MNMSRRIFALVACSGAASLFSGCEAAGLLADAVTPETKTLKVNAEYRGLENRSVAVLVDANPSLLFEQPLAQREVCEWISQKLASNVPGIKVIDAKQVVDFQNRNLYWNTATYSELATRLKVTRLVVIELTDYRLHERGNVNIWRGVMSGNVAVAEADGPKPDDLIYDAPVTVAYPPDKPSGVLNSDQRTIRFGALDLFSNAVVGKFYDHTEEQKR